MVSTILALLVCTASTSSPKLECRECEPRGGAASPQLSVAPVLAAQGKKPYLVVSCDFLDSRDVPPIGQNTLQALFYDPTHGAAAFYREMSGGKLSLEGSMVAPLLHLPRAKEEYLGPSDSNGVRWYSHQALLTDIVAGLGKAISLDSFEGLAIFPNVSDDDSHSHGGSGLQGSYSSASGLPRTIPVLFVNPFIASQSILVHELGHHFQIGHVRTSNKRTHAASAMAVFGKKDPVLGLITTGHTAWHRKEVGWLDSDAWAEFPGPGKREFTLTARGSSQKGLKLIQIPSSNSGACYAIELVLPSAQDHLDVLGGRGVVIHRLNRRLYFPAHFGVFPQELEPEAIAGQDGTIFLPTGHIFRDNDAGLLIQVNEITRESASVSIEMRSGWQFHLNSEMKSAIEFEKLRKATFGGNAVYQDMSYTRGHVWSGQGQVFYIGKVGDSIEFSFNSDRSGLATLLLGLTASPDYGKLHLKLNGQTIKEDWDCYAPVLSVTGSLRISGVSILQGNNTLAFQVSGKNEKHVGPNLGFGFDCLATEFE